MESLDKSRREFIQKATYIAPAVLTLSAVPMIARSGSLQLNSDSHGGGHHRRNNCRGQSMMDDLNASASAPGETLTGKFGCTDLKDKLLFK